VEKMNHRLVPGQLTKLAFSWLADILPVAAQKFNWCSLKIEILKYIRYSLIGTTSIDLVVQRIEANIGYVLKALLPFCQMIGQISSFSFYFSVELTRHWLE
jgi:hypothetical protein